MHFTKSPAMCISLASGERWAGESFGALREVEGEVIFTTAMTGYVETLTDPSYRGQILVLTYPLQGNYGVPIGPYESSRIQVQGVIVSHYTSLPSHHASVISLGKWLEQHDVPGICGVDTRTLTRVLRTSGTIHGQMGFTEKLAGAYNGYRSLHHDSSALGEVTPRSITHIGEGTHRILVIDTGSKDNIIRSLVARNTSVIRAPWDTDWEDHLSEIDGVFLTNGPGDPTLATSLISRVRNLLKLDLPIFGICFGHQILALAAGGNTYKMQFGNRSVNQPVKDLSTGRCFITSQNHGYVVNSKSLPPEWEPWFVNLNDNTNEGMRHRYRPISSVQFHPEARPGPNDTVFLFDDFLKQVLAHKEAKLKAPGAIFTSAPLEDQVS